MSLLPWTTLHSDSEQYSIDGHLIGKTVNFVNISFDTYEYKLCYKNFVTCEIITYNLFFYNKMLHVNFAMYEKLFVLIW
jgi:hypothetical protein